MAGTIRAGMAGWVFEEWRGGAFYPAGLKQKDELSYASRHVTAIEINSTFYRNQTPSSFLKWAGETPAGFRFTVKGPQLVTHIKKLNDVEIPLANFFASGVFALGQRLGPICWQLPGNLGFNPERVERFLALLPKTPAEAVALAQRHDDKIAAPFFDTAGIGAIRHAIEVRHRSFATPAFIDLLRAHNVALVIADTADWPFCDQTADFTYCRLQGAPGADHYGDAEIAAWAQRLTTLAAGGKPIAGETIVPPTAPQPAREIFAFFVSTDKKNAPRHAAAVLQQLGLAPEAGA